MEYSLNGFMDYLIGFIGFVATSLYLYSDFQKDDKKLDFYYTLGNVVFVIYLNLIGTHIASITVILAILRNIILRKTNNEFIKGGFLLTFVLIFLYACFWADVWQESLPALVSLIMTYSFAYTNGHKLTISIALCSLLWLLVGISVNSYSIVLMEILSIIILIVRAYRQELESRK